jgi:hypothetical protein
MGRALVVVVGVLGRDQVLRLRGYLELEVISNFQDQVKG